MARVVAGLVLLGGFVEKVGTPVCYAADYAAMGEDNGAGCTGDPEKKAMLERKED